MRKHTVIVELSDEELSLAKKHRECNFIPAHAAPFYDAVRAYTLPVEPLRAGDRTGGGEVLHVDSIAAYVGYPDGDRQVRKRKAYPDGLYITRDREVVFAPWPEEA